MVSIQWEREEAMEWASPIEMAHQAQLWVIGQVYPDPILDQADPIVKGTEEKQNSTTSHAILYSKRSRRPPSFVSRAV